MKKLFILAMAVFFGIGNAMAGPVDVNTAKTLGQKFVQNRFEKSRNADLNLTYTVTSDRGEACVYVFNVGDKGFVLVSASENVRMEIAQDIRKTEQQEGNASGTACCDQVEPGQPLQPLCSSNTGRTRWF